MLVECGGLIKSMGDSMVDAIEVIRVAKYAVARSGSKHVINIEG